MNKIMSCVRSRIQHFNPKKYWKMREYVITSSGNKLLKFIYLYRIKKMDAYNNASFGTHFGYGAQIGGGLRLPHGLNGIIVTHNAVIGNNVTIFHQVTIGEGKNGAPVIGDNVMIGPGAKIVGKVHVGNNVNIGANCVVFKDIPDNATVVAANPKIVER